MTKRPRWTAEEVAQNLSDDEDEMDDPDEPLMPGSDDEFSDLELDSDDDDDITDLHGQQPSLSPSMITLTQAMAPTWTASHQHHHPQLLKLLMVSLVE